ncbi:MAG: citrate transporter [Chloroflexi bacterium]|nr:citrate transporter [Chloroflexota bacterium]
MKKTARLRQAAFFLLVVGLALVLTNTPGQAQDAEAARLITGQVFDKQDQPVIDALVTLRAAPEAAPVSSAATQPDGRYALSIPKDLHIPDTLTIRIKRAHFQTTDIQISAAAVQELRNGQTVSLPTVTLQRRITIAFWLAALVFAGMLALMATGKLHNTLAALLGATTLFAVSYLGQPLQDSLFIFDFNGALHYIDWNVIFLIMGMMIVIAVIEGTGLFQWLAFMSYRLSGGHVWLLVAILMLLTGVVSAFLDNVTTMLLMTPITVQIALALGINPLALLVPEVMASNVVGVSTLIGTPTNILIGSYGGISFNDFLTNLTPGVLLALVGLIIYSELIYRKEFHAASTSGLSKVLLKKLAKQARITEPENLKKAGVVGAGMLILFIFGERVSLLPAVTALIGATALLVWIRPDVEEMIEAVDWTTLVFFMALFIVVGAIQEVGLISYIADGIGFLVGDNLVLAMLSVTWLSALFSTVIANIPFTAAMLPVIGYLTTTVPGAQNDVLFYCLSIGAAMGGNGSLIGASANMVTAGVSGRAGYSITYAYFFKKGFPALLITVALATIWLLIRFL